MGSILDILYRFGGQSAYKMVQNGGCSISLTPFHELRPKLHQGGAFWTYYAGLEANQSLRWFKIEQPPYLRGCLSFGGYFFTGEEHFYRYIDMWLKIGQKGLFRGLASMEATQSQSTQKCKVCPKCSPLVKFWSQFIKRGQGN